jgi:TetR/AcrR family transcriptional repressor of mexJK operon
MENAMKLKGRPKSKEKRQKILQAAEDLFTKHGFEGVSMDLVAEQADVSKQTVYSHFQSKERLFSATISQACEANMLSAAFIDENKPCEDMLLEIARRFINLLLSEGAIQIYRLAVGNAEQHPHLAQLFYQAGPQHTIRTVTDYLIHQHKIGALNITNPQQAANQFLSMLEGDMVIKAMLNVNNALAEPAQVEDYLKSCVALFVKAYSR